MLSSRIKRGLWANMNESMRCEHRCEARSHNGDGLSRQGDPTCDLRAPGVEEVTC
jgi:hypothetical protein